MNRMMIPLLCASGIIATHAQTIPSLAFTGRLGGPPAPPWEVKRKDGQPRLRLVQSPAGTALRMECDNASFSVQRRLDLRPADAPILRWQWRVEELPGRGDVRDRRRNDQALQLLLLFDRGVAGHTAISYVWDSNAPVETTTTERWNLLVYRVDVKVVVLNSGPGALGQWVGHRRDVRADYRRLYGRDPGQLLGIRLQTNCQYTRARAAGEFAAVALSRS